MNNDYKIKGKALEDITIIAEHIREDNEKAALKFIQILYNTFEKLAKFPNLGISRKDFTYKDVRFFVVKKHYLIVYNIENNFICILRVLSSYQNICALL